MTRTAEREMRVVVSSCSIMELENEDMVIV